MLPSSPRLSTRLRLVSVASILLALLVWMPTARAQSAYVRVSQVGYETGETPFRAYLMSTAAGSGASFRWSTRRVPPRTRVTSALCWAPGAIARQ